MRWLHWAVALAEVALGLGVVWIGAQTVLTFAQTDLFGVVVGCVVAAVGLWLVADGAGR